ncbi:solute carrier family 22 member 6-A-like [Sinocyclocheilus grahami]|uniref:solute carrier family 22 member 6-A-like n=1 Tax=Sinocyclocheilus grahami TaxID=75366 RepID=UPI0007AD2090|nr:PREDICTED: solute carrier family 22 member 6-A-like [Sinocyclocheilus grahami]
MNFDKVLDRIGGFGRFQKTLYVWICLPQIFLAFHMLVSVFTGAVPPHLCRSAWPAGDSGGTGLGFNFSIAPGESCTSFQDGPLSQLNHSLPITEHLSTSNGCTGGWEFSKEVFLSTVVTEWDLVCENATLNNIGSSIYMFGLLVGAVLFGALADNGILSQGTFVHVHINNIQSAMNIFYIKYLKWVSLVLQSSKISEKLQDLRKYTVIDLVRTPRMRTQSLILFYLWFVNVLVYYGLSLNISDFGMNIYLTQMIFGLVEMPARTITLFTLNRSRRISQLAFLAVGGLACLLTIFIPDGR